MSKFHSFEKIEFKGLITSKIHIFHEISSQIRFNTISDTFFPNINSILLNYDGNMHILDMHIWRWHKVALEMVKFEDHFMPSPLESLLLYAISTNKYISSTFMLSPSRHLRITLCHVQIS